MITLFKLIFVVCYYLLFAAIAHAAWISVPGAIDALLWAHVVQIDLVIALACLIIGTIAHRVVMRDAS